MKKVGMTGFLLFALVFTLPAGGRKERSPSPAPAVQPAPASSFYAGDGGKGMSIAILAPKAPGLAENQGYIPALVQGELVSENVQIQPTGSPAPRPWA